ncbi:uncharacterized protein RCC_05359 [Ramularia collo-cygni]|uniref:gamma-glutamylcyclotransferase n=1 Tax=Ramularia collo-cygni TaxID=112498 RepID=A0A2D3UW12_9PEZI|nr:uncharacterized protein RCC_05359 [Ramularia collo-cygni]CZT19508.1 uncharacterized protein RCC_05359 [Ramularia collo-cygni]
MNLSFSSPPSILSFQASNPEASIYFGYGSNLWMQQMKQRCPTSKYLGIARLNGYRWIIYERGYANIVEVSKEERSQKHDYSHEVWGLVYSLEPSDEEGLDGNEGIPYAYTKEHLECDFFEAKDGKKPDITDDPQEVEMLAYINLRLTAPSHPKKEYIYRMNMGIEDALEKGVPRAYVDKVMRQFIPDVDDGSVVEVARKQALQFDDEN